MPQISMRPITHDRMSCHARVCVEAYWTDWTSSSTLPWSRLVPSSTWCFASTLNSFRLHSWLPSWHRAPLWKREKWIGVCLPLRYILHPPRLLLSLLLHSPLQSAAHSSSCQGEALLHGEAPMPLSNFTLEWSWAEHANPDITKQIKSRGWAQRRGRVLRMLPWTGGGRGGRRGNSCQPGWAALCLVWSGHPTRRILNWLWMEGSTGGRRLCCCWSCPRRSHDGVQLKALLEMKRAQGLQAKDEPHQPRQKKNIYLIQGKERSISGLNLSHLPIPGEQRHSDSSSGESIQHQSRYFSLG